MSGHSKWAQIKRKKAVTDQKRGAAFTKMAKIIAVAARKGKDPEMNPELRAAIDQARGVNMPKDNIEKAILKGAGELPGAAYEEVVYEAYGPGGIAMIIEGVTDNSNRTVSFVRSTLAKHGGSLGGSGSVLYMFEQKAVIRVSTDDMKGKDRDAIELALIEAGAEDIQTEEEGLTVVAPRGALERIVGVFEKEGVEIASSGVEWMTGQMVDPETDTAEKLEKLVEVLEEDDDVNDVYTNANL